MINVKVENNYNLTGDFVQNDKTKDRDSNNFDMGSGDDNDDFWDDCEEEHIEYFLHLL